MFIVTVSPMFKQAPEGRHGLRRRISCRSYGAYPVFGRRVLQTCRPAGAWKAYWKTKRTSQPVFNSKPLL